MKVSITATPAERRDKAGALLRKVAADLAGDSALAKAVLDLLNDLEVEGEKDALRVKPLRDLAARLLAAYRKQLDGAIRAILEAYRGGRLEKALTPTDLDRIEAIIRRRHAAAAFVAYGPDALTPDEIAELERAGLSSLSRSGFQALEAAHRIGRQLVGTVGQPAPNAPPLTEIVLEIREDEPELGAIERASIRIAAARAGEYIRDLGDRAAEEL